MAWLLVVVVVVVSVFNVDGAKDRVFFRRAGVVPHHGVCGRSAQVHSLQWLTHLPSSHGSMDLKKSLKSCEAVQRSAYVL